MKVGMSLTAWVLRQQRGHPGARGELSTLLTHVALAVRSIAWQVATAPLGGLIGHAGSANVHGEQQAKLDVVADELFLEAMSHSGLVCTLVSEERDEPSHLTENWEDARYTVFYDPLDGSSNIDVNVTVGTIFGIYRHRAADRGRVADLFRPGTEQIAAGYAMYGACTQLVLVAGDSLVQGFTLAPGVGEFFLTHPDIRMPEVGKTYSVNESRAPHWDERTAALVNDFRNAKIDGGPRSARYVGSLIADFHRTLLKGGIFMYPGETAKPEGKLRLMYEAKPLALIAERAGGAAHDGKGRILARTPTSLHERTPLFIGSKVDVEAARAALGTVPGRIPPHVTSA
jgi:fructose-1,6-bisphosphatase I